MPAKETYRIIVDVNIWVRLFRSAFFRSRCSFLFQPPYILLYSRELLNELDDVIQRPRHRACVNQLLYEERIEALRNNGMNIEVRSIINACRDPKDNYLLALAKDGGADYLITDDKDLLILQQFGKTKIGDLTAFEKE